MLSKTFFIFFIMQCFTFQCCNLMLVEVIPKEPLSFSVFHYKNPKLQHTVQVVTHCTKEQSYFPPKVRVSANIITCFGRTTCHIEQKCDQKAFAGVWLFCGTSRLTQTSLLLRHVECLGASVAFVVIEPLLWSKHEIICGSYMNKNGGGCILTFKGSI